MKNIIVTGFDPFGGETNNPSFEAVKQLPDEINGVRIIKKEIPTVFFKSKEVLLKLIEEYKPVAVVNVGQAGGRESISLEKFAYNLMDASIPDNAGNQPKGEKVSLSGPEIIETLLDIEKIKRELVSNDISCSISESAGRYVCNYVMYSMLLEAKNYNYVSGFVHVPYSKEQVMNKKEGTPCMEIAQMTKALNILLETVVSNL